MAEPEGTPVDGEGPSAFSRANVTQQSAPGFIRATSRQFIISYKALLVTISIAARKRPSIAC